MTSPQPPTPVPPVGAGEARRLAAMGQRYRALRAEQRRGERERRAVNYRLGGVYYRLLPGQRLTLPLADGGRLTLCGE